jgi:hypothetical protein
VESERLKRLASKNQMRVMNGVERAAVDRDLFQCLMFNAQRSTFNWKRFD